ncbi:MAG TPA: hypothetical protein PKV72_02700 [Candidatus Peribacteria bacterium]|nr:hypothetical protein [Candidatus Peribacteria bacterium]
MPQHIQDLAAAIRIEKPRYSQDGHALFIQQHLAGQRGVDEARIGRFWLQCYGLVMGGTFFGERSLTQEKTGKEEVKSAA